ncbi:uncharacterized protein K452DRAFT_232076 [Aplosporella prunicola CBS 121167]|uniref:Uncharacterized protein n=1 Tax=Aplosporella prunicola CBS 121167 TaxID=1176127 RepID=A0A6A6BA20_9PEZI|nr:uncharacterized protein K452DRAFT_232076 [Aplosporella prunicola CBS 121167]KAF2139757.1 hypothetical protein K452DRAFT_232076 [Aplosporella prunicola CBS 121167]
MEWTKQQYNKQYDAWVPWLEDQYLKYFTKDNKASYTAKDNLAKTKLASSNENLNTAQDAVHGTAADQLGQEGLARPVGDAVSKEGINRAERGGRDEQGDVAPGAVGEAAQGGKKAAGWVGGLWGGGGGEKKEGGK